MTTLLALFVIAVAGAAGLVVFILIAALLKMAFQIILVPLKVILLPLILILALTKVAVLVTLVTLFIIVLTPLAVTIGLILAPFLLIGTAAA